MVIRSTMIIIDPDNPQAALDSVPDNGGVVFFPDGQYTIDMPLRVRPNTTVRGESHGSVVQCVSDGWLMTTADSYGIFQVTNANNVTIENLTIRGTKSQPINRSPKLVMSVDSNDLTVQDCRLEQSAFEGIWQGGSIGKNIRHIYRNNRVENVGWPAGQYKALPAIQMNCVDSLAYGNLILDCGCGIGASGSTTAVFQNTVLDCFLGIATGDGNSPQVGMNITDNFVRAKSRAGYPVSAILLAGSGGDQSTNLCARNRIEVTGTGSEAARGIRCTSVRDAAMHDNEITIKHDGIGIEMFGSFEPSEEYLRVLSGNKIQVLAQSGYTQGVIARPQHNGGLLRVISRNNSVTGVVRELNGWSYDFRRATNGKYDYALFEDFTESGLCRVEPQYWGSGEQDSKMLTIQSAHETVVL